MADYVLAGFVTLMKLKRAPAFVYHHFTVISLNHTMTMKAFYSILMVILVATVPTALKVLQG